MVVVSWTRAHFSLPKGRRRQKFRYVRTLKYAGEKNSRYAFCGIWGETSLTRYTRFSRVRGQTIPPKKKLRNTYEMCSGFDYWESGLSPLLLVLL